MSYSPKNDQEDGATASKITAIPENKKEKWQTIDMEQQFFFDRPQHRYRVYRLKYPLVLLLWFLSLLLVAWITSKLYQTPQYSYETGFDTDLDPIRPFLAIKKVKFTGGLKFSENGTTYRDVDPNQTQFVGEPSPQLDNAWKSLIRGQGVDLRGDEAVTVADITYQKPGGWYLTGPDAFHQLHCLNSIRMALRPDYYTPQNEEPVHTMHIYHCLDYLRQGIMCASDMTTIPIKWSTERARILQQTDVVHTCRDFDKIHAWTAARDASSHPVE
ncbi:hypothetical protein ACQKWADRAFT_306946 [Trichoderma austrokoningii]